MLGITGVLASGLNRRYGWPLVALAAVAAVSPDWDGLTIIAGSAAFAASHRVWGHNVLSCILTGVLVGAVDYRFDVVTRFGRLLTQKLHLTLAGSLPRVRDAFSLGGLAVWISVAVLATVSHLAADLVFSGTEALPDWELQLFWPFSATGYVYPLIAWGDAGVSILFVTGMFAMWKWPARLQAISLATLAAVALYVAVRGAWL